MTPVNNLSTAIFALSACLLSACATVPAGTAPTAQVETSGPWVGSKPNIIIILTDDQGYADVGFNGSTDIPTPHIDRVAYEGVRFDRGYVSFPVCGPSRAGLLTGRYQSRFGFDLNPSESPFDPRAGLPLEEHTIADVLGSAGYKSSIIGKWHMGNHPTFHPLERGFTEFFGFTNGGHNYFADRYRDIDPATVTASAKLYQTRLIKNRDSVDTTGYLTDILSNEAVDFIERRKDEPFFLYLSYNAPHAPVQVTDKYLARFPNIKDEQRRKYAAMVSAVDDGVGRVLDTLDELEIADNTLVFFLSDNGGPLVRAKNGSINLPLRGGKGDLFEGGVRVPFAIRWPAQIPAGMDYSNAVSSLDILATAASAASADVDTNKPLDGVDLVPFLQNVKSADVPHDALYWRYLDGSRPVANRIGMVSGDDKLVRNGKNTMLFDLEADSEEQKNLAKKNGKTTAEMTKAQKEWDESMGELNISIYNEWPKK